MGATGYSGRYNRRRTDVTTAGGCTATIEERRYQLFSELAVDSAALEQQVLIGPGGDRALQSENASGAADSAVERLDHLDAIVAGSNPPTPPRLLTSSCV